ncbi:MAG: oligosaccharide flippase family protein [Mangrovibacterium sp.]
MNPYVLYFKEKAGVHKTLIENFSYLSALQVFNLILPLITYPYLIRVLGKETYGLVVFAQAVTGYLRIAVEFGFNISATKAISIYRNDRQKLSEIVSSVLLIKTILFALTFAVLLLLFLFIPQIRAYKLLFVLTMWVCLYEVIFPSWYFQGIEKMKYITYVTLVSRLIFLGLIFILIHSPSDYLLFPAINGIGAVIAGCISLYLVFFKHKLTFIFRPVAELKRYFSESVPIFISNLSVQIYLSTNKILVGIFLGLSDVAYYDLGEKLLNLFKVPVHILSQVLFPKMSSRYHAGFLKKTIGALFLSVSAAIILFQFTAEEFIGVFAGQEMVPASNVARILTLSLLPLIISNGLGIQTLLSQGFNRPYSNTILHATVIYFIFILMLILTGTITIYTISWISILIELYMLTEFYLTCKKLQLI